MKKIKVYLLFFVFIVTITGLSFDVIIPNIYALTPPTYNQQVSDQRDNLWQLGKNLSIGDSYNYKICDPSAIPNYSAESYHYFTKNLEHNSSLCYFIKLDFVNLLNSDENQINSNIWVVQASISDVFGTENSIRHSVFHIDSDSFEVRSADTIHPDTIRYTQSLENTIFSIFKYTASEPKLLQKNIKWGEVTEYLDYNQNNPDIQVLQDNLEFQVVQNVIDYSQNQVTPIDKTFDVFEVGYEMDIIDNNDLTQKEDTNNVINSYLISPQFPFPMSGILYSPAHIIEPFKESEFQLVSFVSPNEIIEEEQIVIEHNNTVVEEDNVILDDDVIVEEIVENNIVEQVIEESIIEEIIISVNPVVEEITEEHVEEIVDELPGEEEQIPNTDSNYSSDKLIVLLILLVVVIGGGVFVYYKKFRNSNDNLKSIVTNNKSILNKIIHFDDKVTINIKEKQKQQ